MAAKKTLRERELELDLIIRTEDIWQNGSWEQAAAEVVNGDDAHTEESEHLLSIWFSTVGLKKRTENELPIQVEGFNRADWSDKRNELRKRVTGMVDKYRREGATLPTIVNHCLGVTPDILDEVAEFSLMTELLAPYAPLPINLTDLFKSVGDMERGNQRQLSEEACRDIQQIMRHPDATGQLIFAGIIQLLRERDLRCGIALFSHFVEQHIRSHTVHFMMPPIPETDLEDED
ncbi:MAG: hypothetical protein KKA90_03145 [Nanoarchaeota archaeon]|nr:hypothetical protein [Nanoarchaeota archaeon]